MIKKMRILVVSALILLGSQLLIQCKGTSNVTSKKNNDVSKDGFTTIFNGKNFDGWYLKIRADNDSLAKKVYAIEDGMVHVFNDEFPDNHKLNTGENDTHGLFYYEKPCSKYILRFEYKWGDKRVNNFKQWEYDAGVYYHVSDDKVWPTGIEYQIRYDHINARNHTGDFIRPGGAGYDWYATDVEKVKDKTYLHPDEGGVLDQKKGWYHHAAPTDNFNGLNDKWNVCEIIVMGEEYAIHKLNGDIVNMAFNLKPSSGVFGFQSETAEIFYKNIEIKEFDEIVPADVFLKKE